MKHLIIPIFIIFLTGCAGSPMAISMKSPEQLKSISDVKICDAYASFKNQKLKNELLSRNLFTEQEWEAIETHGVFIGMSLKSLVASRPNLYPTGVSNIRNYGECEVYSEFATTLRIYYYVVNEKLAGYQIF